jgi:hypothetical protein
MKYICIAIVATILLPQAVFHFEAMRKHILFKFIQVMERAVLAFVLFRKKQDGRMSLCQTLSVFIFSVVLLVSGWKIFTSI